MSSNLLRISEAAALGLHAMNYLVGKQDVHTGVHEISTALGVSENHMSKVCQRLTRQSLLDAVRGPGGGVKLTRKPEEISLLSIYEAIDGPMTDNYCLLGKPMCSEKCIMGSLVKSVTVQIKDYFAKTTLADLAK